MMMDEDRLGEYVRELARDMDPVPPAPREQMWARIQEQRAARRSAGVIALRPRQARVWVQWSAGLAAMLLVGIGIGRLSVLRPTAVVPSPTVAAPASVDDGSALTSPYRLVATRHFKRTENLLTAILIEAHTRPVHELQTWARDLRTETLMLLQSPAASDPVLRQLLQDVELLLSQIAAIPSDRAAQEVELIQEGINQGDVLLRLRAATATRTVVGT